LPVFHRIPSRRRWSHVAALWIRRVRSGRWGICSLILVIVTHLWRYGVWREKTQQLMKNTDARIGETDSRVKAK
jgi:hypothetical protein